MATNFLWYAGSSNNGLLIASPLTLLSSEFDNLASTDTALSSAGGSSGLFNNSNTGQGMICDVFLTLGTISSALSAGANLSGWWIESPDSGSTFEHTVTNSALARPPDFIIPLPATAITGGWQYKGAGPVMVPALPFYVFVQNNTGQEFAASGSTLRLAPYAMQY
jgi:hypothetical protein